MPNIAILLAVLTAFNRMLGNSLRDTAKPLMAGGQRNAGENKHRSADIRPALERIRQPAAPKSQALPGARC